MGATTSREMSAASTSSGGSAEAVARAAKEAFDSSQVLDASERMRALEAVRRGLVEAKDEVLAANAKDLELAGEMVAAGQLSKSLVKRLARRPVWADHVREKAGRRTRFVQSLLPNWRPP